MLGEAHLPTLLRTLSPALHPDAYVFCSLGDGADLTDVVRDAFATVREKEGLTIVLPRAAADARALRYDAAFRMITLQVHSSLEAVGLTAAVASQLAERGISANVIAGFYHDHIFVPAERADEARAAIVALAATS